MDRPSLIFCALSVIAAIVLSVIGYGFAALPDDVVAATRTPQPAAEMGMVDIGDGFGEVAVSDLLDFYIENPPVKSETASAEPPERRFGGC